MFKDYLNGVHLDLSRTREFELIFPRKICWWENNRRRPDTLRPSGTEPKMKLYISISGTDLKKRNKLGLLMNALII